MKETQATSGATLTRPKKQDNWNGDSGQLGVGELHNFITHKRYINTQGLSFFLTHMQASAHMHEWTHSGTNTATQTH